MHVYATTTTTTTTTTYYRMLLSATIYNLLSRESVNIYALFTYHLLLCTITITL